MLIRPLIAWLVILALAIANGVFREAILLPNLAMPAAYVASGLLLSALILAVAIALKGWMGLRNGAHAVAVGFLWLALTLVFEFGFGLAQGHTWPRMLEAYTFQDGNIWPLVLVVVLVAPRIALAVRGQSPN